MSEEQKETGVTVKQTAITLGKFGVELQSMDDLWRFAKLVAASGLAPKGVDTPEKVAIAVQAGLEIGLKPMQALQSIAVINGRPAVWGDAVIGLCQGTGQMEVYRQEKIGEPGKDSFGYRVTVKRRGFDPVESEFTVGSAKQAALWGKSGPWAQYPDRMLMLRARAFALRDTFADVLKGCPMAEDVRDMPAEVPVTITEPDGSTKKVKARGVKGAMEKVTGGEASAPAPATPPSAPPVDGNLL